MTSRSTALETIRQNGTSAVEAMREKTEIVGVLKKQDWGRASDVSKFKPGTWMALASIVQATGCAMHQLDVLGGQAYLNIHFWTDKMNVDPTLADLSQKRLSWNILRDMEAEVDKNIQRGWNEEARDIYKQAQWHKAKLLDYGVPDKSDDIVWAYLTQITRQMPGGGTPVIEECKIVDLDTVASPKNPARRFPGETARSRSLRRCASRAFPAILTPTVIAAEQTLLAHRREVEEAEVLPSQTVVEGTVLVGTGEPQAVVEDDPDVKKKARGAYFATIKACGVDDEKRRQWQAKAGFPASTTEWTVAHFDDARSRLTKGLAERTLSLLGPDKVEELALDVIGKATPATADEWMAVKAAAVAQQEQKLDELKGNGESFEDEGSI